MDPHAVSSAPVLGFLNNVYEGLVRRGPDMAIEGSLATSWEPIGDGRGLAVQPARRGDVP
jgi:peptide/nickel transport system substrate-binding protein